MHGMTALDDPRKSNAPLRERVSGPVDLNHLGRYTLGDRGLEREVLHLFLAQLPETIAALSTATTERDWKMAAHTLKGSGRAVGAWQIAQLAEAAERLPFTLVHQGNDHVVSDLAEAASEARAFIDAVYGPV